MIAVKKMLRLLGIEPKRLLATWRGWSRYWANREAFLQSMPREFTWGQEWPILDEWGESSGNLGGYFHQDLLVARWIYEAQPLRHVDIGSRVDGFIAHLAVFREVEVLDIRPQPEQVPGVQFHQMDLMAELPSMWRSSTVSLSCLHTIEHFGLGRYGDAIDPRGYEKGIEQLKAMVAPGGVLYLSTPIGPQRVEFNAHRVFALPTVLSWFEQGWKVEKMVCIDDQEQPREVDAGDGKGIAANFGCYLGLIVLALRKITAPIEEVEGE